MPVSATRDRPARESEGRSEELDGNERARRLQRMGAVTVGVSLPRVWVGERGLTAGSTVHLSTLPDGSLLLRKGPMAPEERSIEIAVERATPAEHLFRSLVAAYVGGATEFVIHEPSGISNQTRVIAKSFCRRTVQPEVVTETESTLTLRDVSLGGGFSLPQLLHRMCQVVLDLLEESGRSWETIGPPPAQSFAARDDEVDRQAWLVERVLGLRFGSSAPVSPDRLSPAGLYGSLLVARALERIADHAVTIDAHGAQLAQAALPRRVTSALSTYHRQAVENLRRSFAVAEQPETDSANDVIDGGEALHATHSALTDSLLAHGAATKLSPLTVASLSMILHSIDRTTAYAQDIAEVGLDRATIASFSAGEPARVPPAPSRHISTKVETGGKTKNERKPNRA